MRSFEPYRVPDGKYFMMGETGMTALIRASLGNGGSKTNTWACNYRRHLTRPKQPLEFLAGKGFLLHL